MPIVREADGLAMSSRNAYLSAERAAARRSRCPGALRRRATRWRRGERRSAALRAAARRRLEAAGRARRLRRDGGPATLQPVAEAVPGERLLVAAFVGATRLIDNLVLP